MKLWPRVLSLVFLTHSVVTKVVASAIHWANPFFLNQRSAVNDVNFQQTLQQEAFWNTLRKQENRFSPGLCALTPLGELTTLPRTPKSARCLELHGLGVSGLTLDRHVLPKTLLYPCLLYSDAGACRHIMTRSKPIQWRNDGVAAASSDGGPTGGRGPRQF